MITGDKTFVASERFALQQAQVEKLAVVYWGRGALWPLVPNERFDVVTVQDPFVRGLFGWWVARRMGAKLNVQVHTDLSAQGLARRMLAGFVLRRADSVRAVSDKIKTQVEQMGVAAHVSVLPIYIDRFKFTNLSRRPHGQKTILWLGRFEAEKDPLLAASVLEAVRRQGLDVRLVMLGSGSLGGALALRARHLPVEFPGWRDPVPYFEEADVVLSTSLHESYGASILEALAAGVPVVAPDVGIAREAGAVVKARSDLAVGGLEVLRSGARGELKVSLPSKEEWAGRWKESLL